MTVVLHCRKLETVHLGFLIVVMDSLMTSLLVWHKCLLPGCLIMVPIIQNDDRGRQNIQCRLIFAHITLNNKFQLQLCSSSVKRAFGKMLLRPYLSVTKTTLCC